MGRKPAAGSAVCSESKGGLSRSSTEWVRREWAPKSSHSGQERTFRPNDHFLFDLNFPSESVIKDLNFGSFFMNKRTREGGRILGKSSRTSEEISPTTEIYKRIIF